MPSTQLAKAIVIAGFGRGIGKAVALHAAALGARVVVNDIDVHAAITVAKSIGDAGHLAVAQATLGDGEGIAENFDPTFACGRIHLAFRRQTLISRDPQASSSDFALRNS